VRCIVGAGAAAQGCSHTSPRPAAEAPQQQSHQRRAHPPAHTQRAGCAHTSTHARTHLPSPPPQYTHTHNTHTHTPQTHTHTHTASHLRAWLRPRSLVAAAAMPAAPSESFRYPEPSTGSPVWRGAGAGVARRRGRCAHTQGQHMPSVVKHRPAARQQAGTASRDVHRLKCAQHC
jgi:hypothetical protein